MFPDSMQLELKCDRHATCDGYCKTLEQYQFSLCEGCLESDVREVNRQIALTKHREELKNIRRFQSAPTPDNGNPKFPLKNAWSRFESVVRLIVRR